MAKNPNLSGNLFTKPKGGLTIKETPLSDTIAQWLEVKGFYTDRLNSGKVPVKKRYFVKGSGQWREHEQWIHLCKKGTPDRFAIVDGRVVFIEVKQKNKVPTPEQLERHDEIRRKGKAIVISVDSFEDFERQFSQVVASIRASKVS